MFRERTGFFPYRVGHAVKVTAHGLPIHMIEYMSCCTRSTIDNGCKGIDLHQCIKITSQNHGFAVDAPLDRVVDTEFGQASVSHTGLNDDVVEGLELHRDGKLVAFSVQYHPEAAAGPHDANHLRAATENIQKENRPIL